MAEYRKSSISLNIANVFAILAIVITIIQNINSISVDGQKHNITINCQGYSTKRSSSLNCIVALSFEHNSGPEYTPICFNIKKDTILVNFVQYYHNIEVGTVVIMLLAATTLAALLASTVVVTIYSRNIKFVRYSEFEEIMAILDDTSPRSSKRAVEMIGEREMKESEPNPLNIPYGSDYEMDKNSFFINRNKLLGKGEYGEVYKGFMDKYNEAVAFKTHRTDGDGTISQMKSLVSELKILMYIGVHDNLVNLLGAYTKEIKNRVFYMAIEFCSLGSLESYLQTRKRIFLQCCVSDPAGKIQSIQLEHGIPCSINTLYKWCSEIATGMEYLEFKKVVHLDLATRNILLTKNAVAKISDFGLSRRLYKSTEYVKTGNEPLPWRWLALESLQTNTYSSKSDVWSFGITIWEIFSMADIPYSGMTLSPDFIRSLENGLCNEKPILATDETYSIMLECWLLDPSKRPKFSLIKSVFQKCSTRILCEVEYTKTPTILKCDRYRTNQEFQLLMS